MSNSSDDQRLGVNYCRKIAENNHNAQMMLGYCYNDGIGVPEDMQEAWTWFEKASKNKIPFAKHMLGCLLLKQKQHQEALGYFLEGVKNDEDESKIAAARLYIEGEDIAQDVQQGLKLLKPLADKNIPDAVFLMGVIYSHPKSPLVNRKEALR